MYVRKEYSLLKKRLEEPRHFIQVLMGPRQIGKSTVVKQVLKDLPIPHLLYAADDVPTSQKKWISDCWVQARLMVKAQGLSESVRKPQKLRCIPVVDIWAPKSNILLESNSTCKRSKENHGRAYATNGAMPPMVICLQPYLQSICRMAVEETLMVRSFHNR